MTLTVEIRRPVPGQTALFSCVGADDGGCGWAWIAGADETAVEGVRVDIPSHRLLPVPSEMSRDLVLDVMTDWPAWQVVSLTGVEIGSGVLIWGDSWLADRVLRLLHLRGCLWRAVAEGNTTAADHRVASDLRTLPAAPDAAIVLSDAASAVGAVVGVCRSGGTVVVAGDEPAEIDINLYTHVHRRGLTLTVWSATGGPHSQAWPDALRLIPRLRASHVL